MDYSKITKQFWPRRGRFQKRWTSRLRAHPPYVSRPLYEKIREVLEEYFFQTTEKVKQWSEKGFGKRILGKVKGRPEDEKISIDKIGEEILERLLKKHKLPALVFSEHGILGNKKPEIFGALDPFDGSKLFQMGFEHMWYTALSFYRMDGKPISCGIADILNSKYYLNASTENYLISLKDYRQQRIFASERKSFDENSVLASYLMSSEYSPKFIEFFGDFIKGMAPKALLYPNGGSCIYAYLASGKVDAYVMFDEPRCEIDPGFPIAKAGGCEIVTVEKDGSFQDYEFIPGKQFQRVPLLVAAATPELRDQLINHYVNSINK